MGWDGDRFSVRGSVSNNFNFLFRSTDSIINAIKSGIIPQKVLLQSHTLWTNKYTQWCWLELREFVRNRIKVVIVKYLFLRKLAYSNITTYSKK